MDGMMAADGIELGNVDVLKVLAAFDEGVIITDRLGRIQFYNDTMAAIDEIAAESVLGKRVTEIYNLDEETSMVMRCLKKREPILGQLFFYRTSRGRMVNTIHSVFPLMRDDVLVGTICFVKDYNFLERTIAASTDMAQEQKSSFGNGTRYQFTDIVGMDDFFLKAVTMARLASDSPSPVMICGETGTGKELFAQSIHNYSLRNTRRFVGINCAAIPENLLEGLLFGTVKGAFTGAVNRAGLIEQANGGTLFLDEVNSMPASLQAKLLRVLQEKKVRRVGAAEDIDIDAKVISSVNTEPHQAIKEGMLRMDLFYRLAVVLIRIPPLRERPDGIETLTRHFIYKSNLALKKRVRTVSPEVMTFFKRYHWPGNVRELEHIIEGTMNVMGEEEQIEMESLPKHLVHPEFWHLSESIDDRAAKRSEESPPAAPRGTPSAASGDLMARQADREREMICEALGNTGGNVSKAARRLGISRQLLHYKIRKYGLNRCDFAK